MFFLEKIKILAQKLQKGALLGLLSVFFIFPAVGLFANEADLPVIIPADELLTPIELRDGLVFEVVVEPETELAFGASSSSEIDEAIFTLPSDSKGLNLHSSAMTFISEQVPSGDFENLSQSKISRLYTLPPVFENGRKHFSVKSIASLGLFGFLGICLSRSELPSKNFSMLCENSLPKSMTRRSANDWKFLWQPVRTTSLWHSSISSSRTLKTSILRPSMSRIPNMSDISSIWLNEMEGSPVTLQEKRINLPGIALGTNQQENSLLAVAKPNALHLNPQAL
ncbi:hypothetical protein LEP1GSC195_0716 [Leptospira wolbachii serovar Codice str. CDC]|uniref:Uncharacterized protein n=1 Tax=Leptospira wolbachii serovar Codice str. CDC TaxID=1218599 RepID=R8ZYJ4_9LEPT|nr:hypothetical protein LEP1GSC195_0716 [Leptospira wolbachii serovar Codice str. CDC]